MATPKEAFFTRSKANEGVRVDLTSALGKPTEHWLRVRGTDSDAYRRQLVEFHRTRAVEIAPIKDEAKKREAEDANHARLRASLVADWSLSEQCGPCTIDNVATFLREAVRVSDQVFGVASDDSLFFGSASDGSMPSQSTDSASTSHRQKEATNPSDRT